VVGVGNIVSVGGSGGGGSGAASGIQTINPGGSTGPTVDFQGVNGIEVTSPSSNVVLIDGAGASGVGGISSQSGVLGVNGIEVEQVGGNFVVDGAPISGLITSHTLQAAYDGGDEIDIRNFAGGLHGPLIKQPESTPLITSFDDVLVTDVHTDYAIGISGSARDINNPDSYAFTALRAGQIILKSSGANQLATTNAHTLLIGYQDSYFGGASVGAQIRTSGSLTVQSQNGTLFDTTVGSTTIQSRSSRVDIQSLDTNGAGDDINLSSVVDLNATAGKAGGQGTGGQITLNPFQASGVLEYRFGPHQSWYMKQTHSSTSGPFGDGFNPLVPSGQIRQMILETAVSKFSASFSNITSGTFNHGFDTLDVIVQVFDENREVIHPDRIRVDNGDLVSVIFNVPQTGRIVIV
jgi:hypothetical protein